MKDFTKYIIRNFFNLYNPEFWSFIFGANMAFLAVDIGLGKYEHIVLPIIGSLFSVFLYVRSIAVIIQDMSNEKPDKVVEMGRIDVADFEEFNKHLQELLVNKFPKTNPIVTPTNVPDPVTPDAPAQADPSKPEGDQ